MNEGITIGQALRTLRENAGLKQGELGTLQQTYVSKIERGQLEPGWSVIAAYLKGCNATPHDLAHALQGEEPSNWPARRWADVLREVAGEIEKRSK